MKNEIAFVIPIFNGKPYITEAIQSVRNQTFREWKLYLVDDCSDDGSREFIENFTDPRIVKLYNNRNLGLYPTLVNTIEKINSTWIGILMQDDRLKPTYLQEMIILIQKYPQAQAFWAENDIIDKNGELFVKGKDTSRIKPVNPGIQPWLHALNHGCIWVISGSMTKHNLLSSLSFRPDLPHCSDYEWLLRAVRQAHFVYYQRSLSEIRVHSKQQSAENLRVGRDIHESFKVIEHNFNSHPSDLTRLQAFYICLGRVLLITRRIAGNLVKGRIFAATRLSYFALRFLHLPFSYR